MNQSLTTISRRKILYGLGILSFLSLIKSCSLFNRNTKIISCVPSSEKRMGRLLTEDGQLVEVDLTKIISTGKKVSDKELADWIKK